MTCHHICLHCTYACVDCCSTFPVFCFFSIASGVDVSNEFKFEIDNIEDKYSTNNKQGKRSPTSLIPVLQIILLACVQLYSLLL